MFDTYRTDAYHDPTVVIVRTQALGKAGRDNYSKNLDSRELVLKLVRPHPVSKKNQPRPGFLFLIYINKCPLLLLLYLRKSVVKRVILDAHVSCVVQVLSEKKCCTQEMQRTQDTTENSLATVALRCRDLFF